MGKTFQRIVLCSTNDFRESKNDRIKGWVEHNGGTFTKELTQDVTHLLASVKAWKRYIPLVREARRRRNIKIVKLEWLEDSLMQPSRKPLDTLKYEFEQRSIKKHCPRQKSPRAKPAPPATAGEIQQRLAKVARDKKIETSGLEFDKACQEFEQVMEVAGYHPYTDETHFVYFINLVRYDILKKRIEKHRLKLFESNSQPRKYACYVSYTRLGQKPQHETLAPAGSTWEFAWDFFRKFFQTRCGVAWEERPAAGEPYQNASLDGAYDVFQYQAPRKGEPEGLRPELRKPIVTVVMNSADIAQTIDARAMTPEGGW